MTLLRALRRFFLLTTASITACAATWTSPATSTTLELRHVAAPHRDTAPAPTVIYLANLAAPRVGTESDKSILASFTAAGCAVVVLDYAHHPDSTLPGLTRDFEQLRRDIQAKTFPFAQPADPARIYVVPSGCRLLRDVVFYRDDANPAAPRTLAMDIIYPSQPHTPVGAVLEFSCDNANRMGNYSLDFCTDVIVPAAALLGHAAAMADHPVAAPYKGFDAMPDVARKVQAAVRTLRAQASAKANSATASPSLPLNGRIVPVGFSRGSGMALLAATAARRPEFTDHGEHANESADVQGCVVMSGRFTYLDLLPDDKMIPRYEKTWGARDAHLDTWRAHGALDYLATPLPFPLFLTINATESPDALHQMDVLRARLNALSSPFIFVPEAEPRGHKMPLDPAVLIPLFSYLHQQLAVASATPATSSLQPP